MPVSRLLSRLGSLSAAAALVSAVSVSVPPSAPGGSPTISPSFIGFSLQMDRWPDWSGTSSPNQFFITILGNLATRTGTPPNIRVGGNSADHANFDSQVATIQESFAPPTARYPFPEGTNITLGDNYYALSRFMPSGTHMTWGVNFGANNHAAATNEVQSILKTFAPGGAASGAGVVLDLLEIGNEPDLYHNNGLRPGTWNVQTYVNTWSSFVASVASAVGLTAGSKPAILGLSFAGSDHGAGGFSPAKAIADGILSTPAGKLITVISQHKYYGNCCTGQVQYLMSKANIRNNLTQYAPDINAVISQGHKFVFGETNSYVNHGIPKVSDACGAALWIADHSLFAATLNVSNLFFHQGVGYKYNIIQPIPLNLSVEDGSPVSPPTPPSVQAPYYGLITVAEFLGTVWPRVVSELHFDSPTLAGYVLYNGGAAKKLLLINSQAFLRSTGGTRPSQNITLSGAPSGNMVVKRLSIPHADDLTGLMWGGQTFADITGQPTGTLQTTTVSTSSAITLSATELVLLTFQ